MCSILSYCAKSISYAIKMAGLRPAVLDEPKPGITIDNAPIELPAQISINSSGVSGA